MHKSRFKEIIEFTSFDILFNTLRIFFQGNCYQIRKIDKIRNETLYYFQGYNDFQGSKDL